MREDNNLDKRRACAPESAIAVKVDARITRQVEHVDNPINKSVTTRSLATDNSKNQNDIHNTWEDYLNRPKKNLDGYIDVYQNYIEGRFYC